MKIEKISLSDLSGGLNDRDVSSALKKNEAARLENYFTDNDNVLLLKRPGKALVQYAPIDPQPFVNDASTLYLWHLDETADPYVDSGASGLSLTVRGASVAVPGIFSNGQRLSPYAAPGDTGSVLKGTLFASPIDNLPAICWESWVNIDPDFLGQPILVSGAVYAGNSGAALVGIAKRNGADGQPLDFLQGLTIHRDYDPLTGVTSSSPYFKFTVKTKGVAGSVTVLQSFGVPTSTLLHVRGEYDSSTGLANLYVNGTLVASATPNGGGLIDGDAALGSYCMVVGGSWSGSLSSHSEFYNTLRGFIDEVRVSTVTRSAAGFPFKKPRGLGFTLVKSDGTNQAIVAADDGLYMTLGDGAWTRMAFYDGTTPTLSPTAYWDAKPRGDILYLGNGVDSPLAWDGSTLVNWMAPVTTPTLSLSATSGTITPGTRQVRFSYLYGNYETGLSPAASIDNAGGFQINVSVIPPRHSNCTGVRIYMDKAGDPATWYLVRQIAHTTLAAMSISGAYTPGSSPSYTSDAGALGPADGSLATAAYPIAESTVVTAQSPNPKYLLLEHDRMFVCGMADTPYTIRWSELAAMDVFIVFSFANATTNQGNLIAMSSYYGEVHVSKDGRATLILRGSNPQNWTVLETLHPSVGAIDHWSYVHHYPFGEDSYVLRFEARDGFYEYAGQEIRCISDKIKGSVNRLASANATRNEWSVTTKAQFMAQNPVPAPPAVTANIQAPRYETDGLRQVSGRAQIVDQLAYLGLWSNAGALVSGNVIAVAAGVAEGQFYFATDAAVDLYFTPDNFQTVQTVTGNTLGAGERIIEIVRQGSANTWSLITDTAGTGQSSGGGYVYSLQDPMGVDGIGPVWVKLTSTAMFYDLDVPMDMRAGTGLKFPYSVSAGNNTRFGVSASAPNNIYINHAQTLAASIATTTVGNGPFQYYFNLSSNPNVSSAATAIVFEITFNKGTGTSGQSVPVTAGFYSFAGMDAESPFVAPNRHLETNSLDVSYTRREFPLWRGGTFRPQAYWDAGNSRLVFLSSSAENASGNRTTTLQSLTAAGALTPWAFAAGFYTPTAFASDGTNLYTWVVNVNNTAAPWGFDGRMLKSLLATPSTIALTGSAANLVCATRLAYNIQNATLVAGAFKAFSTGVQDFWTFASSIRSMLLSTGVTTSLQALTANGDSGPAAVEIAVQTTTPYAWFVAIQSATTGFIYKVAATGATASVQEAGSYLSPSGSSATTGILSNLLFVPSSDVAGGNLWADRLYWMASSVSSTDSRFVQHGVPGVWTVLGTLTSEAHNLGSFSAFDSLASTFANNSNSGGVTFYIRNAADLASLLAAAYQTQAANQKITGYSPVQPYFQWKLLLTWNYSTTTGALNASPTVDLVGIGFFLGNANLPRVVGMHWQGRTFWDVAEDNSSENNVVLVCQKNGSWMKIYGWRPKSMFLFRDQMVALEDYQFVRLMTGTTDAGAPIVGKARTGALMGFVDKLLSRVQANVASWANSLFSSGNGYVKITPYQNKTELPDGAWVIPLPNTVDKAPYRVLGVPDTEFSYTWVRALSLEVGSSEDTTGGWIAPLGQVEEIQQIDIELEVTEDAYDLVVQ